MTAIVKHAGEYRSINQLKEWDQNPRGIKADKFNELKERIKRFGQFKPVIITPEGEVIGGNMRLKAYRDLGINDVWVSVVHPKTEAEKIEIALADNEEMGYYEEQALAELIEQYKDEIKLGDYSIHLGEPISLEDLLAKFGPELVEDEVPEVTEEAESVLGEVYSLGRHRVMCGDSTKIEDVEKLMDGKKADMVFTDPPYGMDLDTDYSGMKGWHQAKKYDKVIGDSFQFNYKDFQWIDCGEQFWWGADYYVDTLPNYGKDGSWFVWDKRVDESKDKMFGSGFEMLWSKNKHQRRLLRAMWAGFMGDAEASKRVHPTQKPTKLCAEIIKDFGNDNDLVIDLFLGSGSTLIACEQTNRTCYGMELDPRYVDVIRKRYAKFIGKEDEWQTITPPIK